MAVSRRIQNYLDANHVSYLTMHHDPTYTSQETAAITHVKGKKMAKAVMLKVKDRYYMAVAPADHQLDLHKIRNFLGNMDLVLADERDFAAKFPGCEIGAVPPLGKLYGVDMVVDECLREDDEIAFVAGSHTDIIKLDFNDFDRLEHPRYGDLLSDVVNGRRWSPPQR